MNSFKLTADFTPKGKQPEAITKLLDGLAQKFTKQTLLGVTGCGKTFAVANVIAASKRPALIIAHNKTLAAQLYSEMRGFFPNNAVEYFVSYYDYYQPEAYIPATDTYIEKDSSVNEQIEQMRLAATKAILTQRDCIIVATVSAIYGLGDPETYFNLVLRLRRGMKINQRQLLYKLNDLYYRRNDIELQRGTYRARGDVIDVFPAESERDALRIELSFDGIENISYFDPLTNVTLSATNEVAIFPKTHYVAEKNSISRIVEQVRIDLKARLEELYKENKLVEAQRLEQRTRYDMEMLLEIGYCNGIENYSRYLSGRAPGEPPPTLMDYLPHDALLFIDESHVTVPQIGGMYLGDRSRKTTLVNYGFRLPSALDNRPLRFDEFESIAPQMVYVSATPADYELKNSEQIVELLVRPTGLIDPEVTIRSAKNQVQDLLEEIKIVTARDERVLVTTLTKKLSENLSEYLAEQGVKVRYLHADIDTIERVEILRDLRLGVFDVLVGINLLREGLDLPEVSLVAILDADKEGFLRSTQSLIQTSGRAARNINGSIIMYADKKTGSMQRAIAEMQRRRDIQLQFNKEHNITPRGIKKAVHDIIERQEEEQAQHEIPKVDEKYLAMTPKKITQELKRLEKQMREQARNLEFEKAAAMRDRIARIKEEIWKTNY